MATRRPPAPSLPHCPVLCAPSASPSPAGPPWPHVWKHTHKHTYMLIHVHMHAAVHIQAAMPAHPKAQLACMHSHSHIMSQGSVAPSFNPDQHQLLQSPLRFLTAVSQDAQPSPGISCLAVHSDFPCSAQICCPQRTPLPGAGLNPGH